MARINKISQRFWVSGISLSLISSISSLIRLRAEGRRLALSHGAAGEKEGPAGTDVERRETGRAMLKSVRSVVCETA